MLLSCDFQRHYLIHDARDLKNCRERKKIALYFSPDFGAPSHNKLQKSPKWAVKSENVL